MALDHPGVSGGTSTLGPAQVVIIVFFSIALYNIAELSLIIFVTFKKHRGLYFWSFVVATWGIAPLVIGLLIKGLSLCNIPGVYIPIIFVGWVATVNGQSVVLYSRLHLVDNNPTHLRCVRAMIIFTTIVCYIPVLALASGANSSNPGPYLVPYAVYERIELTAFFIQEFIISGLYIWETAKLRRLQNSIQVQGTARGIMTHLTIVNIIVVLLDIAVLGLEYAGIYNIQIAFKPLVYSLKLKLEFSILNRLVELASMRKDLTSISSLNRMHANAIIPEIMDDNR